MIGKKKNNFSNSVLVGEGLMDNRYSFGRRYTGDHAINNELAPEEDSPLQSKISSTSWFDI